MGAFNGNHFTLAIGNVENDELRIAHSTEVSLSFENQLIEVTTGKTDGWAEYTSARRLASVTFTGLQDYTDISNRRNTDELARYFLNNDIVYFNIGGTEAERGSGYIESLELVQGSDEAATYSGVLRVTGPILDHERVQTHFLLDTNGDYILTTGGDRIQVDIPII